MKKKKNGQQLDSLIVKNTYLTTSLTFLASWMMVPQAGSEDRQVFLGVLYNLT